MALAAAQGKPPANLFAQRHAARGGGGGFGLLRRRVLGGFVLLDRALQTGMLVAPLPRQVFSRVAEFILIERELRFGQFQPAGGGFIGVRLFGQFCDASLVSRDAFFGLANAG